MSEPIGIVEITEALKTQLEALVEEKREIRRRDREVDVKMSALHQSLSGLLLYADALDQTDDPRLASLVKSIGELLLPANSSGTLTEACRNALRTNSRRRMSAMDVRKALEGSGFDFSKYTSNPLSSIHTTLRRLKENDEVKENIVEGTKLYRWIHKPAAADSPSVSLSISEMMRNFPFPQLTAMNEIERFSLDAAKALKGLGGTSLSEILKTSVGDVTKGIIK